MKNFAEQLRNYTELESIKFTHIDLPEDDENLQKYLNFKHEIDFYTKKKT
jgi:hypothetical protein